MARSISRPLFGTVAVILHRLTIGFSVSTRRIEFKYYDCSPLAPATALAQYSTIWPYDEAHMLIWTHVAVGYLLFSVGSRYWRRETPAALPTLAVAFGTLFPDLIDKPLAIATNSFPSRSLTHSVFTTVIVLVLVWIWAREHPTRRRVAIAGGLGYASHLGADVVDYFVLDHGTLRFLLWPVLSPGSHIETVSDLLQLLNPTPYVAVQTVITVLAIVLWVHDGMPGASELRSHLSPRRTA